MTFALKSVFIAFYLSLNLAMGEVVQTEVLLWKSWNQANTDLSQVSLSIDHTAQVGTISINSWNLNVPNVLIHAESVGGKYQINSQKIVVHFDNLKLSVQIPSLSIDQTIERVVNGSVFRIHVQSTCSPIFVTNQKIQTSALLVWRWLDNVPTPFMENMILDWADDSWTVSEIKCSGPMGIDNIFLAQLNANLKDRQFIRSLVFEKIKEEIQNQWFGFHQSLISGTNPLLPVSPTGQLKLDRVALWNQNGIGILGRILPPDSQPSSLIKFQKIDSGFLGKQKLLVPKAYVLHQAQKRIVQTQLETINLRENSSFMSLLRSRFLQFFLWPDLMNFRKDARFEIGFHDLHNLVLDWKNKDLIQVSGNLNAQMMGERDSTLQPYLDLAFGFSVNAEITQVGTKLKVSAENPQINYSYRFNQDYVQKYPGSSHISSTITKKAKSAVVDSLKIYTEIDLNGILGNSFQVKDFQIIENTIAVDF